MYAIWNNRAGHRATFQIGESYKSKPDCCKCSKLHAALIKRIPEIIIIVFICTVIAVSFTVPIIIYGVDADRRSDEEDNVKMLINLNLDNCTEATDVQVGSVMKIREIFVATEIAI